MVTVSGLIGGYIFGALQGALNFDSGFDVEVSAAADFDAQLEIAKTGNSDFDAEITIFEAECEPEVSILVPDGPVSGLAPPYNLYLIGSANALQGKTLSKGVWTFSDFQPATVVAESGVGLFPIQHRFQGSGYFIARFTATDSDGISNSAIVAIDNSSGITPVIISLSGVPQDGLAALTVDFSTGIHQVPNNVAIVAKLLDFDDGQTSVRFSPTHVYQDVGIYNPIWSVRDSQGVIWSDSILPGVDRFTFGGPP